MALMFLTVSNPKQIVRVSAYRVILIVFFSTFTLQESSGTFSSKSQSQKLVQDHFDPSSNELPLPQSCFTADDLTVMQAKRHYEQMIPESLPKFEPLNDVTVTRQLEFIIQLENQTFTAFDDHKIRNLMLIAFADTYGAFLFGYFVPVIKYSYYGGFVSYVVANSAIQLMRKYQTMLGHRGSYWKLKDIDPTHFLNQIEPINGKDLKTGDHNCHNLLSARLKKPSVEIDEESRELLLISIPPNSNVSVHNPKSKRSSRMLLNYYIEIVHCFKSQTDQLITFQRELYHWISDHMEYILTNDTLLYPAFEGVLRIKKSIDDGRKLPKKSITKMNEPAQEDDILGEDTVDSSLEIPPENPPEMSALKKLSIWTGCSLAVLLVVYIVFKMRQNQSIIASNRFTHRRRKSFAKGRSSSKRKLSQRLSEPDEITVFDRFERDTNNGSKGSKVKDQRKVSIAKFIKRIQPSSWKHGATKYVPLEEKDAEANRDRSSLLQQQKLNDDQAQAGPSGLNRKQGSITCRCVSCIGKESSDPDSSESTTRTVKYSMSSDQLRISKNKRTNIASS